VVFDPALALDTLDSPAGAKTIIEVIRKNPSDVKAVLEQ